jgi:YD repeat-containing protein
LYVTSLEEATREKGSDLWWQAAVLSQAAMDGGDGGKAVLYGAAPLSTTHLELAVDEDQIGDSERNHTNEQVAYLVFEEDVAYVYSEERTINYTYDGLYRLTEADYSTGEKFEYQYDAGGNPVSLRSRDELPHDLYRHHHPDDGRNLLVRCGESVDKRRWCGLYLGPSWSPQE